MDEFIKVTKLSQIKALSDPLRLRIVDLLSREARTTKQVAEALGEKPTRLYHHMEALEAAGLVVLEKTRPNRGTVEKYYRAAGRKVQIDGSLLASSDPDALGEMRTLVTDPLEQTLADLRESLRDRRFERSPRHPRSIIGRVPLALSAEDQDALHREVHALLEKWEARSEAGGAETTNLTIALFAISPPTKENAE